MRKGRDRAPKSSHGLPEDSLVSILQVLVAKVDEISKELFKLAPKLIQQTSRVKSVERENISLKNMLVKKNAKIEDLDQRLEVVDIQATSEFVILSGQSISSDGSDLCSYVSDQISQVLHVGIEKIKCFSFQRLGKNKNKVLVRIPDTEDRIELFRAARTIRSTNLFVNDFLTPVRQTFFKLRKQKHQRGLHSVFSFRGQIYIKKMRDGDMILIKSLNDLD